MTNQDQKKNNDPKTAQQNQGDQPKQNPGQQGNNAAPQNRK